MPSPRIHTLAPLALAACLPWGDPWVNLTNANPGDSNDTPETSQADATEPALTTGNDPDDTSTPPDTTSGYGDCEDFAPATPSLVFNLFGDTAPALAVTPNCRILTANTLAAEETCPAASDGNGPAHLARLYPNGTCGSVVPLPGDVVYDIAAVGDSVIVAGETLDQDDDAPMLVHVSADDVVTPTSPMLGTRARALAVTQDHVFVTGACNEDVEDSLWLARFDHDLSNPVEPPCGQWVGEARAVAATTDHFHIFSGDRSNQTEERGFVLTFSLDLFSEGSIEIEGITPGIDSAGMVSNKSNLYLATGCSGEFLTVRGNQQYPCEDLDLQPGGDIALIRLGYKDAAVDSISVYTFGGAGPQHPVALALEDEDTLVMAGDFEVYISLVPGGGAPEATDKDEGSVFVAWFDISGDTPAPKHLMVLASVDSGSVAHAHDLVIDHQTIFLAGVGVGGADWQLCVRDVDDPDTCLAKSTATGERNFLAFLAQLP